MTRWGPGARGFTLLEVLIAMGILAVLMAAITSTQGSSLIHGARVYNLTTATQLLPGVVLDLEEEYRLEGFPDNSVEGRGCDLPRGFRHFDCEYDLIALDVGPDNISAMGEEASTSVMGSGLMESLCMGGPDGQSADPNQALANMGQDVETLGALVALADPAFQSLCGIDLARMCQNIPMLASFIPTIIENAAKATRKLRVRLSWDEVGNARKQLQIETFLTAVPEAEEQEP